MLLRALDDSLLFVDPHDQVPDDLIDDLQATIELFHQLAATLEDLQHVGAFLVVLDFVGQLAPAPVVGLHERAAQLRVVCSTCV